MLVPLSRTKQREAEINKTSLHLKVDASALPARDPFLAIGTSAGPKQSAAQDSVSK